MMHIYRITDLAERLHGWEVLGDSILLRPEDKHGNVPYQGVI